MVQLPTAAEIHIADERAGGLNEESSVLDPDIRGVIVPRPWRKDAGPRFGDDCGHQCRLQGRYSDRGGSGPNVPGPYTQLRPRGTITSCGNYAQPQGHRDRTRA